MAIAFKYKVDGINCINCANGIKSHLNKKQIKKVHVDIPKGIVTVFSNEYTAHEIEGFIGKLGYKTVFFEDNIQYNFKLEFYLLTSALLSLPLLSHMFVREDHFLQNPWLQICLCTPVLIIGYKYFAIGAINSIRNLNAPTV